MHRGARAPAEGVRVRGRADGREAVEQGADGEAQAREVQRAAEAQELLDRSRQQRGVFAQGRQLRGVAQESKDAVADEVDRGLAPHEEEERHRDEFDLGQRVALVAGVDPGAPPGHWSFSAGGESS